MSEIEVGDYVRIDNDFRVIALGIGKVIRINKDAIYVKNKFELPFSFKRENITKNSKNIIDLIEVGDYVNGILITGKEGTLLYTDIKGIDNSGYHIPISQYEENIKSIVTKEQFKSVIYELEEGK